MKTLSFVALITTFAAFIAGVVAKNNPPACANQLRAIPLYRAYSQGRTDHFYTTNLADHANAVNKLGYSDEGITGYIFSAQGRNTTALYQMYSVDREDHFYTTNAKERSTAIASLGYKDEGIAGYVYPHSMCGALPLYKLYSIRQTDHLYTMSAAECDSANKSVSAYVKEGKAGFILSRPN